MKLAINACHGGFSLSPRGVKRLAELRGQPCYFFKISPLSEERLPLTQEEAEKTLFWRAYTVPNPNEIAISQKNWDQMTDEEKDASNKSWAVIDIEHQRVSRDDPDLIRVIEELGDAASGHYADLRIVEIPDGVEYTIEEYGGSEWVAEKHRIWRAE